MNLITIINNQNLLVLTPIIYEFKDKIKHHFIVVDDVDEIVAKKFKKSISKLNKKYNIIAPIEILVVDEDSKQDLTSIKTKLPKKNLYLNATNADNTLLVVFSGYVLNNNGVVISYDKFENTYNFITLDNLTNHKIKNNLNLKDFFILANYKASFENSIDINIGNIRFLFKNTQKFFKVISYYNEKKIKKIPKKYLSNLKSLKMIENNKITKKYTFGYLFELFIFDKLKKYNFDDIALNLEVDFDENIKNEFDIFAIKDNHIYIIECKLGNLSESESVIYKLDSLIEHFGDDSKGLIVNIQEDTTLNNKPLRKLYSDIKTKRANYNSIEVYNDYYFNEKIFDNIVSRFFKVVSNNISNTNKHIFLLGGYDLEMIEIKKILDDNDAFYIDRKLSWGAKLSDYQDILNDEQIFYGIELISDIPVPKNYILIDHHNDMQTKDSSIEQVAEIFNIKLNRFQKLVAINDKSYIDGMKEFGATEVEIDYIRELDRKAQGVTSEDELLAKEQLDYINENDEIIVIKTTLEKFSPLVDRLYGKNILIYNNKNLTYYGRDIKKLVEFFAKEIKQKIAYYGGNFGFFGVSNKNIDKYKSKILEILKDKK